MNNTIYLVFIELKGHMVIVGVTFLRIAKLFLSASQVPLDIKNLPAKAGDIRDLGSIPGLGRSPGGGHDNPLQCSCLENPMDRGAWWATVHRVPKRWT